MTHTIGKCIMYLQANKNRLCKVGVMTASLLFR